MATVIQRICNQNYESGLRLGSESLVRKAFFGRTWNRIRIGVMYSITPLFNELTLRDVSLHIGLVGGNYPMLDPRCDTAIGISLNSQPGRNVSNPVAYVASSFPYRPVYTTTAYHVFQQHREFITSTAGGNTIKAPVIDAMAVNNFMVPVIVDFSRPQATMAGAWTITVYSITTDAGAASGFRQNHLEEALETWATPTINGVAMTAAATTFNASEFGNVLDKICVNWNSSAHPITLWSLGASMSYDTNPTYTGYTASSEDFIDYTFTGTLYSGSYPAFNGTIDNGRWGWTGTGVIFP